MKPPENALIARENHYLLALRKRNDKSQWLAQAGYILENRQVLESDLRNQILSIDATFVEKTEIEKTFSYVIMYT